MSKSKIAIKKSWFSWSSILKYLALGLLPILIFGPLALWWNSKAENRRSEALLEKEKGRSANLALAIQNKDKEILRKDQKLKELSKYEEIEEFYDPTTGKLIKRIMKIKTSERESGSSSEANRDKTPSVDEPRPLLTNTEKLKSSRFGFGPSFSHARHIGLLGSWRFADEIVLPWIPVFQIELVAQGLFPTQEDQGFLGLASLIFRKTKRVEVAKKNPYCWHIEGF